MNLQTGAPVDDQPAGSTRRNPWVAVVGRSSDGRSPATEALVEDLRALGVDVGGLRHVRVQDDSGERTGYDLVDRATGRRRPLCRLSQTPDICDLEFDQDAFADGRQWCLGAMAPPSARQSARVVVIEAGPVEAGGGGHRHTIDAILSAGGAAVLLLSVRPYSLSGLALELPDPQAWLELPASDEERRRFAAEIALLAREQTSPS